MMLPPLFSFIRPVGPRQFGFMYKVLGHHDDGIIAQRWGMTNGLPVDDGHVKSGYWEDLTFVRPGLWRTTADECYLLGPVYYALCLADSAGQMDLFLDAFFSSRTAGRAADGGRDEKASKPSKISPVSSSFFCQAGEVAPPDSLTGGTFAFSEKQSQKA